MNPAPGLQATGDRPRGMPARFTEHLGRNIAVTVYRSGAVTGNLPEPVPAGSAEVVFHVVTGKAGNLDEDLNAAVQGAIEAAARYRHGLVLTRHSEALFTVRTSPDVPYGLTIEHDQWHRNPDQ